MLLSKPLSSFSPVRPRKRKIKKWASHKTGEELSPSLWSSTTMSPWQAAAVLCKTRHTALTVNFLGRKVIEKFPGQACILAFFLLSLSFWDDSGFWLQDYQAKKQFINKLYKYKERKSLLPAEWLFFIWTLFKMMLKHYFGLDWTYEQLLNLKLSRARSNPSSSVK